MGPLRSETDSDSFSLDPFISESSSSVRKRVVEARKIQQNRFQSQESVHSNAMMNSSQLRSICKLDAQGQEILKRAMEKLGLSARAGAPRAKAIRQARIRRVGWTGMPRASPRPGRIERSIYPAMGTKLRAWGIYERTFERAEKTPASSFARHHYRLPRDFRLRSFSVCMTRADTTISPVPTERNDGTALVNPCSPILQGVALGRRGTIKRVELILGSILYLGPTHKRRARRGGGPRRIQETGSNCTRKDD